jgi:hypothetical protein
MWLGTICLELLRVGVGYLKLPKGWLQDRGVVGRLGLVIGEQWRATRVGVVLGCLRLVVDLEPLRVGCGTDVVFSYLGLVVRTEASRVT